MSDLADNLDGEFRLGAYDSEDVPHWKDKWKHRKVSPRTKIAAHLYSTGIAKTLKEAGELAGLGKNCIYPMNSSGNEEFQELKAASERRALIATGDINMVLQMLGREAVAKIADLMDSAEKEEVQLKAAVDLADRSQETSKVQKLIVGAISLDGADVDKLTAAMVEAAEAQRINVRATVGDYVTVDTAAPVMFIPAPTALSQPFEDLDA